ncbi:MAG: glycosyltransferase family 39 protein [Acidimicrobiia bacterium]
MPTATVHAAPGASASIVDDVAVVPAARGRVRFAPAMAALTVFGFRMITVDRRPTEWDSVLLLNGVRHFDVMRSAPHPPGSFLYVELGAIIHSLTGLSALWSLSLLSALASGATAGVAWSIGRRLRNNVLGFGFALACATSPIAAYYGSVVATYAFDFLAGVVLLYCALRVRDDARWLLVAAATVGAVAGARPGALVFSAPVLVVIAVAGRVDRRAVVGAVAVLGAVVAAWLIPLELFQPGGMAQWRAASDRIASGQIGSTSWFGAAAAARTRNLGVATGYTVVALLPLLPALVLAIVGRVRSRLALAAVERQLLVVAAAVVVPALGYGMFVHWGKAGYLLAFLAGVLVIPFVLAARLSRGVFIAFMVLVCGGCAFQLQRYAAGDGVIPESIVDRGPWFTQRRYWAPMTETLGGRARLEQQHDRTVAAVQAAKVTANDRVVMIDGDSALDLVHAAYAFPDTEFAYVDANVWVRKSRNGYLDEVNVGPVPQTTVPAPTDGRTFVVMWRETPDMARAVAAGDAVELPNAGGDHVYRVDRPIRLGAVTVGAR